MILRAFFSCFAGALVLACSSPVPESSSETHFVHCQVDTDCAALGPSYSCDNMTCLVKDGGAPTGPIHDAGPKDAGPSNDGKITDDGCVPRPPSALTSALKSARPTWTTVRVDYLSNQVLSYQYGAQDGDAVFLLRDQQSALVRGAQDAGFDAATGFVTDARLLSTDNPPDEWVFEKSPSDFGEVLAVSARTGLTVFGGTIVWAGRGEIAYPKTFRPASDLGTGCAAARPVVDAYDLGFLDPATLASGSARAMDAVWSTALPEAMSDAGESFQDAVVLLYPRTVGAFDASAAEWIVILNSAGR